MFSGIFQHRRLLRRRRFIRRHGLDRRPRSVPGPLSQPAIVTPHRHTQRRQRPLHRPTAPLLGLLDLLVDPLLQLRRQLTVVFYSESVFLRSRFSAVISAITALNRSLSRAIRVSAPLGFVLFSSKMAPADA